MGIPHYIVPSEYSDGDRFTRTQISRITQGMDQQITDLAANWQVTSRSELGRTLLALGLEMAAQKAKEAGVQVSQRLEAWLALREASREAEQRKQILDEIQKQMTRAVECEDPVLREKLEKTAQGLAEAYGICWPPLDMPLISYDSKARYVYDRISALLRQSEKTRITFNELNRQSSGLKDDLLPALERLAEAGYITLTDEPRSGPKTVWIGPATPGKLSPLM